MIKGKALRVQDRHYVERWVEVDKSTRGNDKRSGESYGPNHNCYRGVRQENPQALPYLRGGSSLGRKLAPCRLMRSRPS